MVAYRYGPCVNCARERRLFARWLCSRCYLTPSIRAKFPTGRGGKWSGPRIAPPGRNEKIEALAALAEAHKPLFDKRRADSDGD